MADTCTNCGMRFLDPEDYRDHLPCETTLQRVERELAEVRAAHARTRAQLDAAREALNSIACLAGEGPDVYAMEGKPLIDLLMVIAREACAALAAARKETP